MFYENQMNDQYRKDEKTSRDLKKMSMQQKLPNISPLLSIIEAQKEYKLIMNNNITRNRDKLTQPHAVNEVYCPRGDCELPNPSYIGQTRHIEMIVLGTQRHESDIKT